MRLLLYSDKPLDETPRSSWQPYKRHGRGTVAIRCPACARTMCLPNHRIDHDGFVTSAVTCPYVGSGHCTMQDADIVLLGWVEYWSDKPN